MDALA